MLTLGVLTLSVHAREGYSSFVCVSVCVSHSLALKQQHCFDVRDRHQREAGMQECYRFFEN